MKPFASIAALSAFMILFAACATSGSAGTVPPLEPTPAPSVAQGSPDLTPAPSQSSPPASGEPTGSPQATPAPTPEGTTVVRAYFYFESVPGSSGLVPVLREVPATKAVATAAMAALLAGPTETESGAMSSAIPAGTRLLGLTVANGVATVDLSSEFESGGGSASAIIRLGQVVFTLTQFPTVNSVLFQIEGKTVTVFGSEGIVLDGPVGRADYRGPPAGDLRRSPGVRGGDRQSGPVTGSAQRLRGHVPASRSATGPACLSPTSSRWRPAAAAVAGRST